MLLNSSKLLDNKMMILMSWLSLLELCEKGKEREKKEREKERWEKKKIN